MQQYVAQVQAQARGQASGGQTRSAEWYAAQEAKKRKEKEEKKALEKEMLKMLGDMGVDAKSKKKLEEEKKAEEERKKAEAQKQHDHDFAEPITQVDQVIRVEGKSVVNRVCAEVTWMNTNVGRTKDGSRECVYAKLSDGSSRIALPVTFIGWTPSNIPVRAGDIVDIRNALAMVRGEGVDLEVTFNVGTVEKASAALAEHIRYLKTEAEELRARGGVPIEELIEEQRAKLKGELTPVTEARFLEWKAKKLKAKKDAEDAARAEAEGKAARGGNVLSGKQLFAYDPTLFKDDEAAEEVYEVAEEPPEEDEEQDKAGADADAGGAAGEEPGDDADAVQRALAEEEDVDLDELGDDDDDDDDQDDDGDGDGDE